MFDVGSLFHADKNNNGKSRIISTYNVQNSSLEQHT